MASSGPALQLGVGLAFGVLSAQVMLYTVYWGSLLLELSEALRTMMRTNLAPIEVRLCHKVHTQLRRSAADQVGLLVAMVALLGFALYGASGLEAAAADTSSYLNGGALQVRQTTSPHRTLSHATPVSRATRNPGLAPHATPVFAPHATPLFAPLDATAQRRLELLRPGLSPSDWDEAVQPHYLGSTHGPGGTPTDLTITAPDIAFADGRQCRALLAADTAARGHDGAVALSSWLAGFAEAEQSRECAHLQARCLEQNALQRFVLRHQQFARDAIAPSGGGRLDASRWRLTFVLPGKLRDQRRVLGDLQQALDESGGGVEPLTLSGDAVVAAEVAAAAPATTVAWACWGVVCACLATYLYFDPTALLLLLLAAVHTAGCLLGAASLVTSQGGAMVAWVAVALPLALHSHALALDGLVRAPGGELDGLHRLAPPLLRSAALNVALLLPLLLFFPMVYVRRAALLLVLSVALSLLEALVFLPLLHAALRPRPRPSSASGGATQATRLKQASGPRSYNTV